MKGPGPSRKLLFAITGHGFGHATRSVEVLREMLQASADVEITVSSTAPRRFFERGVGRNIPIRAEAYEPGTIQKNCFEVDIAATREAYRGYLAERRGKVEAEVDFLRAGGFDGVISDIPAIPIAAASRLGLRTAGLWNFTWDWILEPILQGVRGEPELADVPRLLQEDYARSGLHLKLPFSPSETPLPHVEPAPLIARKSRADREATLGSLGLRAADPRPVILVAMGGWECRDWDPIDVQGCEGLRFLVVGDVPMRARAEVTRISAILEAGCAFSDLVAAADAVLTKPGYGIASECVLNRTPLLGVERRGFREAPELIRDLVELGRFEEISIADFFQGRWEPPLRTLLASERPWARVEEDGARRVAARLCEHFSLATAGGLP
ncbi:MAG TPA: hypothetical protein VMT52_14560 [Planctomycetota bacterium]|nr:hypothetical protein [Planctomycetota bacterium]